LLFFFINSAKKNKKKDKTILQNRLEGYLAGFEKFRGRIIGFVVWGLSSLGPIVEGVM